MFTKSCWLAQVSSYREARTGSRIDSVSQYVSSIDRPCLEEDCGSFDVWGEDSKDLFLTFEATADIVPDLEAPPKKALLSRGQFGRGRRDDRDGQVPMR